MIENINEHLTPLERSRYDFLLAEGYDPFLAIGVVLGRLSHSVLISDLEQKENSIPSQYGLGS